MAKIAHSSIDENGKISGGVAGDQTKRECCIRDWYDKPFGHVLRIEDEKVRTQFANNMIDCTNNDKIGYDQGGRNTILTEAEKVNFDFSKITKSCESDCSSVVTACILGAIYKVLGKEAYLEAKKVLVTSGNCCTTRTLRPQLLKLKMIKVTVYTSSEYTRSTNKAKFGDIYNKEGSHVVAFVNDGKKVSNSVAPTTPTPTQPTTNKVIGTAVAKGSMKVRDGASSVNTKTIGYVSKGQKVEVLEVLSNGWYKIVWKNGVAYTSNASNKYYTYTPKTSSTSTPTSSTKKIKAGDKFTLNNTPVYTSEKGNTIGKRSGVYYAWENEPADGGRIKMTNAKNRVGVKGQVSFFVDVASLK